MPGIKPAGANYEALPIMRLQQNATETFWTAYRYIQSRTKLMRYSDYTSVHIPLGGAVTKAACKTVFTQRLKNSGMRWSHGIC